MPYTESPLWIDCDGDAMLGIVASPAQAATRQRAALLIAVGGPQYRVGSHRQFTLLARRAAEAGFISLRFDFRGMGDSSGDIRAFDAVAADYRAALDALAASAPATPIVLWGLCDAASAALMYGAGDSRVGGLVLLNPWVRSEQSHAAAQVKHYYSDRLRQGEFWRKLVRGEVDVVGSVRALGRSVAVAMTRKPQTTPTLSYQERMAHGLRSFTGPVRVLLSGRDLVAREFEDYTAAHPSWRGLLDSPRVTLERFVEADHTFSTAQHRNLVERSTLDILQVCATASSGAIAEDVPA